ncbi:MAG TPA: peptidoglycan DD-metalloendopeptidase family protein [Actinomycetes bacterium]|nr:peptidoglycan DD-metalloendopeptidase family protein [Actinomycetes bacterium]
MRGPVAAVVTAAAAAGLVVVASGGGAGAVTLPTPTLTPLPTVSVPLPTDSPLPLPSTSQTEDPGDTVGDTVGGVTGGSGGADGSGGSSSGATTSSSDGTATSGATAGGSAGSTDRSRLSPRERRAADATPVVAGTAAARDLVDDESSPAMRAAGRQFLQADEAIAEIARQKRLMAELKQDAVEAAATYEDIDTELTTSHEVADALHGRYDEIRHELVAEARRSYQTGQPTTDDGTAVQIADSAGRLRDAATRADLRVGWTTVDRERARAEFQAIADRYNAIKDQVERSERLLDRLAAQRSGAVGAIQDAKASDVALNQARVAESGELGAQIRAASARLEAAGRTVEGIGDFVHPAGGVITSPYGMRYHPILHYRKLHTGTDFSGGGSAVRAADDGRVIMTVVSEAYGNFTVIDHGVVDGHRVTTAYAHQAEFLVREGQRVSKGEQIGVIGSTGWSTGPHLHFEVREDGTVVDPMTWFGRG